MHLMEHCFLPKKKAFFLFKVFQKVRELLQISILRLLGLMIFVCVETFRRRPFAQLLPPCFKEGRCWWLEWRTCWTITVYPIDALFVKLLCRTPGCKGTFWIRFMRISALAERLHLWGLCVCAYSLTIHISCTDLDNFSTYEDIRNAWGQNPQPHGQL